MLRNRLYPEVQALLGTIEAEGGPALEKQSPAEARQTAIDALKSIGGQPEEITGALRRHRLVRKPFLPADLATQIEAALAEGHAVAE